MIIDIHSHTWQYPDHFGDDFRDQAARAWGGHDVDLTLRHEDYARQSSEEVKTVVFGGKAKLSGMWVDDTYVADYVAQHPDNLIGFLSVDPTQPGWRDELEHGHQDLKLRGIKLLSMYAGFKPCDPELDDLWSYASRHGLPASRRPHLNARYLAISTTSPSAIRTSKSSWRICPIHTVASAPSPSASTRTSTQTSARFTIARGSSTMP